MVGVRRILFSLTLIFSTLLACGRSVAQETRRTSLGLGPAVAMNHHHDPQLLGVLDYKGGFVDRLTLSLAAPTVVTRFKIALPSFCRDVDVLEAGTRTEGVEDLAREIGTKTKEYAVNEGHGARISAIFATLNGPTAAACQIPIYATDSDDDDVPTGDDIQGSYLENGLVSLVIGPGAVITSSTYRLTDLSTGFSAPIVFSTALRQKAPGAYHVEGSWTDQFLLVTGQVMYCTMPVYADLQFSSSLDGATMVLTYPRQISATTVECTYLLGTDTHRLQRR